MHHLSSLAACILFAIAFLASATRLSAVVIPETMLVPRGATWKYLDDGRNQGTAWRDAGFNDSAWQEGPAQLGYGDGGDEETVVGFGSDERHKHITTYFRHQFQIEDSSRIVDLSLMLLRDDGAAVYLNGTEIVRDNLPGQLGDMAIAFDSLAIRAVGDHNERWFFAFPNIDSSLLVNGTNTLAVEIHQHLPTSSDISFDFQMTAVVNPIPEPTTLALAVMALVGCAFRWRRGR